MRCKNLTPPRALHTTPKEVIKMSQLVEVKVPDIGDFSEVPIIELFVKVGDSIKAEDAICTLESDKATMDVPSPAAGVVKELKVKLGDKVAEGSVLLTLEVTRRTVGPVLLGIILVFIVYNFVGEYLPGYFGHRGSTMEVFLDRMVYTYDGIFGTPVGELLAFAGLDERKLNRLIMGGPMMGFTQIGRAHV